MRLRSERIYSLLEFPTRERIKVGAADYALLRYLGIPKCRHFGCQFVAAGNAASEARDSHIYEDSSQKRAAVSDLVRIRR